MIGFPDMPAAGRRKECTKVSNTVRMNRVLSGLPNNETRENLFRSTKVKLGEDEDTVTDLSVMHSRLRKVPSPPSPPPVYLRTWSWCPELLAQTLPSPPPPLCLGPSLRPQTESDHSERKRNRERKRQMHKNLSGWGY